MSGRIGSPAAACSVAGGFCYGRLLDESCVARESQNSPSPARASDRLLSIGSYEVLTSDRHSPVVAAGCRCFACIQNGQISGASATVIAITSRFSGPPKRT